MPPTSDDTQSFPPPTMIQPSDGSLNCVMCALCHEISCNAPVLSPCEQHVFCQSCIEHYLTHTKECPVDKHPLESEKLKSLNGILLRLWSNIAVKCPNEWCSWTGVAGNYLSHIKRCHFNPRKGNYVEEIRKLKQNFKEEKEKLLDEIGQLEWKLRNAEIELSKSKDLVKDLEDNLKTSTLDFDNSYQFGRTKIIPLSQLICRYLDEKPAGIDRDRIYNCLKARYDDLRKGWDDNPEFYESDMAMLLSICRSSSWFTDKQHENIREWIKKIS